MFTNGRSSKKNGKKDVSPIPYGSVYGFDLLCRNR
jgi:hypothetical protein